MAADTTAPGVSNDERGYLHMLIAAMQVRGLPTSHTGPLLTAVHPASGRSAQVTLHLTVDKEPWWWWVQPAAPDPLSGPPELEPICPAGQIEAAADQIAQALKPPPPDARTLLERLAAALAARQWPARLANTDRTRPVLLVHHPANPDLRGTIVCAERPDGWEFRWWGWEDGIGPAADVPAAADRIIRMLSAEA